MAKIVAYPGFPMIYVGDEISLEYARILMPWGHPKRWNQRRWSTRAPSYRPALRDGQTDIAY